MEGDEELLERRVLGIFGPALGGGRGGLQLLFAGDEFNTRIRGLKEVLV